MLWAILLPLLATLEMGVPFAIDDPLLPLLGEGNDDVFVGTEILNFEQTEANRDSKASIGC